VSRFGFLQVEQDIDIFGKREAILEGFLLERSINMLYAKAGTGKTWLCFGLSKVLVDLGYDVLYLDPDNGIDVIKERGFDKHINAMDGKMTYLNGDLMDDSINEMREVNDKIENNAKDNAYDKAVFFYDGLSFFLGGGIYDETKISRLVTLFKKIRKAGGTVIVINHTTKNGDAMKGGGSLINALDEVWRADKIGEQSGYLHFTLSPEKYRLPVQETSYSINTQTLALEPLDTDIALMSEHEKESMEKVKELLQSKELTQGEILTALGKSKADKTMLNFLEKFDGKFWNVTKKANRKIYNIL
jgi:hypothetical protein